MKACLGIVMCSSEGDDRNMGLYKYLKYDVIFLHCVPRQETGNRRSDLAGSVSCDP